MSNKEPYSSTARQLLFPEPFPIHKWNWDEDNTSSYISQEIDNNIIHGDVLGITRGLQVSDSDKRSVLFESFKHVLDDLISDTIWENR